MKQQQVNHVMANLKFVTTGFKLMQPKIMLIQKKAEVDVENQREFEDTVSQGEQEK